ncbi:MAG: hypothetical protein WC475_03010, partial [Candidatus Paceibacterota bacterium]
SRARTREQSELGGEQRASEENFDVRRFMSEERFLADVAASFQQAVIDVLTAKTFRAAREFKARSILLSGGVANNKSLRQAFRKESKKNKVYFFAPSLKFTTDNASMTAVAAYFDYLKKEKHRLIAQAHLNL